jgi:hypothetical protein
MQINAYEAENQDQFSGKSSASVFGGLLSCHVGNIFFVVKHYAELKKDSSRMTMFSTRK